MPGSRVSRERRSARQAERTTSNRSQASTQSTTQSDTQNSDLASALGVLTNAFTAFQQTVKEHLNIHETISSAACTNNNQMLPIYSVAGVYSTTGNTIPHLNIPNTTSTVFMNNPQNLPIYTTAGVSSTTGLINNPQNLPIYTIAGVSSTTGLMNNPQNVPIYTIAGVSLTTDNINTIPWNFPTRINPSDLQTITSTSSVVSMPLGMNICQHIPYSNSVNGNFNNYIHQNIPLSAQVPDNLKKEIWSGEYVELSSLNIQEKELSLVLMSSGRGSKKLGFKESGGPQVMSIDQWLSAFMVYSSVYLQKFPSESEGIFRYIETVRSLEKKGGNWRFYDEKFRRLRKTLGLKWDNNHQSLWLDARLDQTNTSKFQSQDSTFVPNGYCHKFHQGNMCRLPCRYSHKCFKCGMLHPAIFTCQLQSTSISPIYNTVPTPSKYNTPRAAMGTRLQSFQGNINQTNQDQHVISSHNFRPTFRYGPRFRRF